MNEVIPVESVAEMTDLDGFSLDDVFALTYGHFLSIGGLPATPAAFWVSEAQSQRIH